MTKPFVLAALAVTFCAAFLISPAFTAQAEETAAPPDAAALAARIATLEKELQALHSDLALLKAGTTPTPVSAALPASSTPAAPVASAASSLLGSTNLSGFIDVYYGYNFNQPTSRTSTLRAFDGPASQFSLNMIQLIFNKDPDANNSRLGYKVALGYGQAMNVVNAADPAGPAFAQYLKEAYFSYLAPVGKGLQIDVGKFVTPHGAEVIETKDNWNYSRGLLFTYAIPFYHFGARAKYAFNDKYSLAGFLVNGWNNVADNNTGKTLGVSFGWTPNKKFSLVENYMTGPEQAGSNANWRQLTDTLVTVSPTSRLTLMANYDYGREGRSGATPVYWTGAAGYVKYALDARTAVGTRYEYYDDHDGFTTGNVQHLNGVTATFERLVSHHLLTRLEFRRDVSNLPTFFDHDSPVKGQNTFTGGLVYMFDTKETK